MSTFALPFSHLDNCPFFLGREVLNLPMIGGGGGKGGHCWFWVHESFISFFPPKVKIMKIPYFFYSVSNWLLEVKITSILCGFLIPCLVCTEQFYDLQ